MMTGAATRFIATNTRSQAGCDSMSQTNRFESHPRDVKVGNATGVVSCSVTLAAISSKAIKYFLYMYRTYWSGDPLYNTPAVQQAADAASPRKMRKAKNDFIVERDVPCTVQYFFRSFFGKDYSCCADREAKFLTRRI